MLHMNFRIIKRSNFSSFIIVIRISKTVFILNRQPHADISDHMFRSMFRYHEMLILLPLKASLPFKFPPFFHLYSSLSSLHSLLSFLPILRRISFYSRKNLHLQYLERIFIDIVSSIV